MVIRFGLRRRGAALQFLSNSRGRRNALAYGRAEPGSVSPASYFAKIVLVSVNAISNI
jgi:hypothetical protein